MQPAPEKILSLRVEFLLKSDGGYPKKCFIRLGNPWESPPLKHPSVIFTSLRPRLFQGTGRAASGGALDPEQPRATGVGPEILPIFNPLFLSVFLI